MARRLALFLLCLSTLVLAAVRQRASKPAPMRDCSPEGRGAGARTWIACAADDGPRRELTGRERVLLGLRVDVNAAGVDDLAAVPGLTRRIAAELVAERSRGGPFTEMEDLVRVRGIGPARLARARPHLALGP
jgi:competence protein ComEA